MTFNTSHALTITLAKSAGLRCTAQVAWRAFRFFAEHVGTAVVVRLVTIQTVQRPWC